MSEQGTPIPVITEWMKTISRQLDSIHDDVKRKADHSEVERVEDRVIEIEKDLKKVNRKVNWFSGVMSTIAGALGISNFGG